ncbi:MAG: transcriptional repressor [Bacteroidetes bacterium]|jgi:Fur family ferric uptake transcriptional regulator|nr:transcriptional repressor [Bacteroidota bacterium]
MAQEAHEETIQLVKKIFKTYLKERNQRQTPERFMVLEEIYRSHGHYDADDIYFNMKKAGTRVSRATVYNTLDLLIECGLVQRQQFGKNQYYYERSYAYQQHDHMICKECGVVIEFCDPRILEIQNLMEKIHDFKVDGHSLHLFGRCNDVEACDRRKNSSDKIKSIEKEEA